MESFIFYSVEHACSVSVETNWVSGKVERWNVVLVDLVIVVLERGTFVVG